MDWLGLHKTSPLGFSSRSKTNSDIDCKSHPLQHPQLPNDCGVQSCVQSTNKQFLMEDIERDLERQLQLPALPAGVAHTLPPLPPAYLPARLTALHSAPAQRPLSTGAAVSLLARRLSNKLSQLLSAAAGDSC